MRRALVVGIDHYQNVDELSGCVADARAVAQLLRRHDDDSPNFEVLSLESSENAPVGRTKLLEAVEALLTDPAEVALLFFAGHGTENNLGGYLVTSDATRYSEGVAMTEILTLIDDSPVGEVIIVLDCCQAGAFGALPLADNRAQLKEGVSVLAAARRTQTAAETDGQGTLLDLSVQRARGWGSRHAGQGDSRLDLRLRGRGVRRLGAAAVVQGACLPSAERPQCSTIGFAQRPARAHHVVHRGPERIHPRSVVRTDRGTAQRRARTDRRAASEAARSQARRALGQ